MPAFTLPAVPTLARATSHPGAPDSVKSVLSKFNARNTLRNFLESHMIRTRPK